MALRALLNKKFITNNVYEFILELYKKILLEKAIINARFGYSVNMHTHDMLLLELRKKNARIKELEELVEKERFNKWKVPVKVPESINKSIFW